MDSAPPTPPVEVYQKPNPSRLVPYENYIAELRRCKWPYRKMAEKLRSECGVEISVSALHGFCQPRGIGEPPQKKDTRKPRRLKPQPNPQPGEPDDDEFDFDLSKPLRTWKDEV